MLTLVPWPVEGRIYDAEMDKTVDLAKLDLDEEELKKLKGQYGWLKVSRTKLLMDLVFVCMLFFFGLVFMWKY